MDQNASSAEDLLYAQCSSHEQLQNKREGMLSSTVLNPRLSYTAHIKSRFEMIFFHDLLSLVLARRLQLRRPREELVNQGIMPG